MALKYGLETLKPVAGIVGFSGFLFPSTKLTNLGKTPILINHGKRDQVVPHDFSMSTYSRIKDDSQVKIVSLPGL